MKRNFIKLSAGIAFTALTFGSFAQKKNVTDAIMTFKKYNPMSNGIEPSKKTAEEARKYIDLAAVNPETAEDFKMHLYRAEIYYSMIEIATLDAAKTPIDDTKMKEYETISKASFKKVLDDPKKTYTSDAQNFMGMRSDLMFNQGIEAYNNKKYDESLNAFLVSYYLRTFINEEYKDAEINTTLSLNNYVDKLIDAKEFDKAIEAVNNVLEIFPNNIDALISMVNIYLQKGDVANTETYINKALAIDAKNKQLYYILGTSYIELKQNEKAAEALSKAIEIDPEYNEALYQLGAHYYNWAAETRTAAMNLDMKDPKVKDLEKRANELFTLALTPLEKYIEKNPNEKSILDILYKTNTKLGRIEKGQEYKKRLEALKQQ
ncbi:MAG: tetratricopeptide repeat protein [Flavobacteriales bacterium]